MRDGSALSFTVRRKKFPGDGWTLLEIKGKVFQERNYFSNGRPGLGPTGPLHLDNDGFDSAWMSWYERFVFNVSVILDSLFATRKSDSRMMLKDHLEDKARVEYLPAHYPGPFAEAVRSDWQAALDIVSGTRYELPTGALDFRQQEDERIKEIAAAGLAAWKAFLSAHAAQIIPAFPSVDPFRGDRTPFVGKWVALPTITPRDWVTSIDQTLMSCTQDGYWYFAPLAGSAMRRLWEAKMRYMRFVTPSIQDNITLIGKILPDPRLLVQDSQSIAGLEVEPVAALIDDKLFVDLTASPTGEAFFAGENELKKQHSALPPDAAPPRQVLEALIAALKAGDQDTWNTLFADWRNVPGEGRPLYYAYEPPYNLNENWIRSRALILESLADVRVLWTSDPVVILRGNEFPGAPLLEQVNAELEHIGSLDHEYRGFNSTSVNRNWALQRRNGGPWRITESQGI